MSSGIPIPRKDNPLSIKIADAIPKAILINTGASAFGNACLKIVLLLSIQVTLLLERTLVI